MVSLLEMALIADDVYEPGTHADALPTWEIVERHLDRSVMLLGNPFSTGFQGAAYRDRTRGELVVAFKGTVAALGPSLMVSDLTADLSLGVLKWIPRQAADAYRYTAQWNGAHGGSCRLTLVGHSLGGALAQVVGYTVGCRFVTFNAPGMAGTTSGLSGMDSIPESAAGAGFAGGRNYRLGSDPVSNVGQHVGRLRSLDSSHGLFTAHSQSNVIGSLRGNPWGNVDPFSG